MYQLQNKLIMLILLLFVSAAIGEQILLLQTTDNDFKLSVQIGTPPLDQYLIVKIGDDEYSFLGQYIFDSSIQVYDISFYQSYLKGLQLYNMKKSSSADINPQIIKQTSSNTYSQAYVQGNIVTDVLQVGNTKFKYTFLSVSKEQYLFNTQLNGVIRLNRFQGNIFDQMYSQNVIKTRDYLISLELSFINEDDYEQLKKLSLRYDLDQWSDNYKYPSNLMIQGDVFAIKAYGVYLNGEDVTDLLKIRTINFDVLYEQIMIPSDLYAIITRDSAVNNIINQGSIYFCQDCKCSEIDKLPKIKVVTQEYVFEITPELYTYYSYDYRSFEKYSCKVKLGSSSQFQFTQQLLSVLKVSIMYQKEISSLKFIGAQTTSHMSINTIIIVLSLFNGSSLVIIVLFTIQFLKKYSSIKLEFYYQRKHKIM
ncbi:transmembrane protein, putative (macronuclear) [Tetrahymena thermophila SB210]|uniref:Transmembrane protein, putative n=1 Tax=Tetrahymena thermophila (strain SB210) TaxID=312017 RepID=I7M1F4_TETTS|nr:transmembrane protein, putative [Tetrahymena thermophila SB210]EAR96221.2 transmembrane protein, putative [Tetrahymena thermophila SB210]|eukprot:XP_001016466.2 transmembrane protein, putative [Tetrahymena thermophila SB210]